MSACVLSSHNQQLIAIQYRCPLNECETLTTQLTIVCVYNLANKQINHVYNHIAKTKVVFLKLS